MLKAVLRANRNQFDPILQFHDRAVTLAMNGHPVDKIELLILGGTWSSYPHQYQEEYIRDLFFAANTFQNRSFEVFEARTRYSWLSVFHVQCYCNEQGDGGRARLSLAEEQLINESAQTKIIGITLETRPDCIDAQELLRFRRYGCTRVRLCACGISVSAALGTLLTCGCVLCSRQRYKSASSTQMMRS